jgi:aspartyl-tRNA(Asn)/glutamyl-tRNA(Gln) amidotransferase subunit C
MESDSLSKEDVLKILSLAFLDPKKEAIPELTGELNSILNYVANLQRYDVSDVPPMSHAVGTVDIMRADQAINSLSSEAALQNSPDRSGNFFRVPLVIEG